ncbi:hypothetical protein B0H19DRAFT_1266873 [Mycena capillaripes]|nr:hypothetical protein B0H19DRAFT_1266873 [Mycena capillaripes]
MPELILLVTHASPPLSGLLAAKARRMPWSATPMRSASRCARCAVCVYPPGCAPLALVGYPDDLCPPNGKEVLAVYLYRNRSLTIKTAKRLDSRKGIPACFPAINDQKLFRTLLSIPQDITLYFSFTSYGYTHPLSPEYYLDLHFRAIAGNL